MWVVGVSGVVGIGPVGARRMIRVRESEGDSCSGAGSGGRGSEGSSFGAVTSARVVADAKTTLSEPRHGVDPLTAALQDLEMQVGAGGVAPVAHRGDLVTGHHALADADQRGVDVAVERDGSVRV